MISKSQRSERMSSLINQKYVDVFRSSAHVGIKCILMHNNGKWKVRNRRVFPCFAAQLLRTGDYSIVSVTEIVSQCLMKRFIILLLCIRGGEKAIMRVLGFTFLMQCSGYWETFRAVPLWSYTLIIIIIISPFCPMAIWAPDNIASTFSVLHPSLVCTE